MNIIESVLWRCLRWPGHEAARLVEYDNGWLLEGNAAFAHEGHPCSFTYMIRCDEAWRTRQVLVDGSIGSQPIHVSIDVDDVWTLNGSKSSDVSGCVDIDLNFSPSTNTLPIRRLDLAVGQSASVSAAWLRFPSFKLERLDQEYARIGEETYSYRSIVSGFLAELQVSRNGLVLNYGEIWTAEA